MRSLDVNLSSGLVDVEAEIVIAKCVKQIGDEPREEVATIIVSGCKETFQLNFIFPQPAKAIGDGIRCIRMSCERSQDIPYYEGRRVPELILRSLGSSGLRAIPRSEQAIREPHRFRLQGSGAQAEGPQHGAVNG